MFNCLLLLFTVILTATSEGATKEQVLYGRISRHECGDNCYLTIIDAKGKEHTGLCLPLAAFCKNWNATGMPDSYRGKKVKITMGEGFRVDGGGNIVDKWPAFKNVQLTK